jgi:hypothetical protein
MVGMLNLPEASIRGGATSVSRARYTTPLAQHHMNHRLVTGVSERRTAISASGSRCVFLGPADRAWCRSASKAGLERGRWEGD